jgi:hypothetical protein
MKFFDENFNKEDAFLYLVTIGLLCFLGWYFHLSQQQMISKIDYKLDHINTEEIKILEAAKMRYEFAGKVLISNSTRINLSFLIGSVMCLLGTLLVIRKARMDSFEASGSDNSKNLLFSIKTTSPGIVLAILGTVILICSIAIKDEYYITDNDSITDGIVSNQNDNQDENKGLEGNEEVWNY